MGQVVDFTLADGTTVGVEVDQPAGGSPRRGLGGRAGAAAERSFSRAIARIRPAAEELIGQLQGLAERPDQVEVEFGIKLSGEVGALIASSSTEANFRVRLQWRRRGGG